MSQPKILMLDIETAPLTAYLWDIYKPHVSVDQIITPTSVLCFAAKWYGDPQMMYHWSDKQTGPQFNKMIKAAHKLLCDADALVHYNGVFFDVPRLNQEFIKLGLPPPPPIAQIDLLKVVRQKFGLVSNKLAFVGPYLKIGEKVKNAGWDLWKGCLTGDASSWLDMERYNKQDVLLLEKLYKKLLPWIDGHPNLNLYVPGEKPVCPNCGSADVQRRGVQVALTYVYARFCCNRCHRWSRERTRSKTEPVASRR